MSSRTVRTASPKTVKLNLIEESLKAISALYYDGRGLSPGMVLAVLPNGNYYASVVRYNVRQKCVIVPMKLRQLKKLSSLL